MSRKIMRQGFSLLEIVSVIMIIGIIASSTSIVLRNAYVVHRDSLQLVVKMQTLDRLQNRFTRDVHAATIGTASDKLVLEFGGEAHQVVYRVEGSTIHRERLDSGAVVARDRWKFAEPIGFETTIDRSHPIAVASMKISIAQSTTRRDVWSFRARLNAWNAQTAPVGGSND